MKMYRVMDLHLTRNKTIRRAGPKAGHGFFSRPEGPAAEESRVTWPAPEPERREPERVSQARERQEPALPASNRAADRGGCRRPAERALPGCRAPGPEPA